MSIINTCGLEENTPTGESEVAGGTGFLEPLVPWIYAALCMESETAYSHGLAEPISDLLLCVQQRVTFTKELIARLEAGKVTEAEHSLWSKDTKGLLW